MRGFLKLIFLAALCFSAPSASSAETRPWAEYEPAALLVMSSVGAFGSMDAKLTLVENLPSGVKALIYTQYNVDKAPAQMRFGRYVAEGKVEIVHFNIIGEGTWTRDVMPIPLVEVSNPQRLAELVGSRHSLFFEPDQLLAHHLNVPLREHNAEYEGGNFMASSEGDCLIVNGFRERQMPDEHFRDYYKCRRLIRFPHTRDIGHIDERVKLLGQGNALTDEPVYKDILEAHGYQVRRVPQRSKPYQNYLNSVILNGTVFVPTFNDPPRDQEALRAYSSSGRFEKVIAVPSSAFVDNGTGGLHCLTATYPASPRQP